MLFASLLITVKTYGDEAAAVQLEIRPSLCILERGEQVCDDEVQISWSAEQSYSACLYASGSQKPIRCWEHSRNGNYTSMLAAQDDIYFQLIDTAEAQRKVLASAAFEVVADAQKYRRRRRNPWSFF
ncbi:DUF3019 domain-containing protein [Gilvimarinus chinensis]|uniref:DUF3019 domain-containing protein n=1 Tax=Gilvimarinus chinensis TaxID=396005 RepID=UPI00037CEB10|nr:DUF3019 domain-containing protein [Gilvimarinus chinensis]